LEERRENVHFFLSFQTMKPDSFFNTMSVTEAPFTL
jgi:hypothetical protein